MGRRPGLPLSPTSFSEADRRRFWSHVVTLGGVNECWAWVGNLNTKGYGRFRQGGSLYYAHRCSIALELGVDIEPSLVVDHLCRTPACVNPRHLELVPHGTNISRGISANRLVETCPRGHAYDAENTCRETNRKTGVTRRICRACKLARLRARNTDPAHKEAMRAYRERTREHRKAYEQSDEYRARRLEHDRQARANMTTEERAAANARARENARRRKLSGRPQAL